MNSTLQEFGPIGEYLPLFILGAIAIGLGFLLANLSRIIGPLRPNRVKESVYESGMDPVGTAHDRFSVKFYMVAMLFILFDIEIVFMYPWAVNFKELALFNMGMGGSGLFPLIEMFIFVVILFVGYIYVWKKGGLEWD
ncbi:MAG: NADH-quinone oxidoreductase subunit A [Bacteroidota bacterium]